MLPTQQLDGQGAVCGVIWVCLRGLQWRIIFPQSPIPRILFRWRIFRGSGVVLGEKRIRADACVQRRGEHKVGTLKRDREYDSLFLVLSYMRSIIIRPQCFIWVEKGKRGRGWMVT